LKLTAQKFATTHQDINLKTTYKQNNMKSKAIELQNKANQLLQMAQDMDKRIERMKSDIKTFHGYESYCERRAKWLNTSERASKRLWSAYLQVLTQIKLEL